MKRVVCENQQGQQIEFKYDGYPLRLDSTDGFSEIEYTVNTSQNSGQDGESYNGSQANKRNPVITANIFEDYQTWGDKLRSFFQPRSWGTVYAYGGSAGRKATYQVEKIGIEETGTVRDATISLICPDPKFYALDDELTQLAIWQGCIRFPLRLPPQINASGQSVTITPDNSINDYDKVMITGQTAQITSQQGKNLFKFNTGTSASSGLTVSIAENGDIHISGIATNTSAVSLYDTHFSSYLLNLLNAGDTYTLSSDSQSGNIYIQINYKQDGSSSETAIACVFGHNYKSFALPSGTGFRIFIGVIANAGTLDETFHVQLEKGSTATPYAPFVPDSPSPDYPAPITGTTALTVSDGENNSHDYLWAQTGYSLPNGVHDTKEFVSNVETHNVGKTVLDGSEVISVEIVYTNTVKFTVTPSGIASVQSIISDRFTIINNSNSDVEHIAMWTGWNGINVFILKSRLSGWLDTWTNDEKVTAFKAWLSANPVTVLYELATPQTITGAGQTIPVYHPTTMLSVDAGTLSLRLSGKFTVTKKVNTLIGNVNNPSAVPMGLTVKFMASGTVVNPSLFDVNRHELMQINTIMHSGDVITITTGDGNKRVKLISGGVTTNINNLMAYPPKWLKAYEGDNLFRYNADSGIDSLSVSILSTQAYWGA